MNLALGLQIAPQTLRNRREQGQEGQGQAGETELAIPFEQLALETEEQWLLGQGPIAVVVVQPEMGLGRQIGAGRSQAGAGQAQIQIHHRPDLLQPLQRGSASVEGNAAVLDPGFGLRQQRQLLLQALAQTFDREGTEVVGVALAEQTLAQPLGPGRRQLTPKTIR